MAFVEAVAPLLEGGGAAGEAGGAGAGGLGGIGKDFNDLPFGKIAGEVGGKLVHAVTGAIGEHGGYQRVEEGPVGRMA